MSVKHRSFGGHSEMFFKGLICYPSSAMFFLCCFLVLLFGWCFLLIHSWLNWHNTLLCFSPSSPKPVVPNHCLRTFTSLLGCLSFKQGQRLLVMSLSQWTYHRIAPHCLYMGWLFALLEPFHEKSSIVDPRCLSGDPVVGNHCPERFLLCSPTHSSRSEEGCSSMILHASSASNNN